MRYLAKRTYMWSSAIAYSIGLIASDGCLQNDGRHIDLTSVDMEQLRNFQTAMSRDLPITSKFNKTGQLAYRVQFSDVAYYDFLLSVGLTPKKSKTLAALKIPDEYYSDFLLGLFDGDGSCFGYMDKRWRSSFMFYITFTSASSAFIDYLRHKNEQLIGTSPGYTHVSARALSLTYAKNDSHLLWHYMYYDGHQPSLTRKKQKLRAFTEKDRPAIIHEH